MRIKQIKAKLREGMAYVYFGCSSLHVGPKRFYSVFTGLKKDLINQNHHVTRTTIGYP